jgi:1-acyl-sn-glycerol-3-phosphate acyltransferase
MSIRGITSFPPGLPRVTNWPFYFYRVFAKWLSFFIFGFASLILIFVIFPPMRLMYHPREKFMKHGRRFVSSSLSGFVSIMHFLRIVDLEPGDREAYGNIRSKIVVANHPSLLDVIMLLSLIPNADCIVAGYLRRSILSGIVRQLYILSSDNYEDILDACTESLKKGNCLIIFPEGTRTPREGRILVKKGAARIAMASGCALVPLCIGGTDKYGLGKKDPWIGFNPTERYVYKITICDEIRPEKYHALSAPLAVRALTRDISASIFPK